MGITMDGGFCRIHLRFPARLVIPAPQACQRPDVLAFDRAAGLRGALPRARRNITFAPIRRGVSGAGPIGNLHVQLDAHHRGRPDHRQ